MQIQYDGTSYNGWQVQSDADTIQGFIESALYSITREKVNVIGAGRTDAGVHAIEQVASLDSGTGLDNIRLKRGINAVLPPDIRIMSIEDAPDGFHARYSAIRKRYTYIIANMPDVPIFFRNYTWEVRYNLDLEEMRAAANIICGRHDFSSFRGSGCGAKETIRNIYSLEVERAENMSFLFAGFSGSFIRISVEADGFLRHMVRNIAGTLIEVGRKRIGAGSVREIIETRERTSAGPTAPAKGLFLEKVTYPL
ncbi:MAG: tRNA pseudouridine(38-40) synthase TruA [Nitrospirota bacterium]